MGRGKEERKRGRGLSQQEGGQEGGRRREGERE
jgi:hypothetical protein